MKRILTIASLVAVFILLITTVAFAQGKANIRGEVTSVNADGTITVTLADSSSVIVHPAAGETFDLSMLHTMVHVKGDHNTDGSIQADWVKPADADDDGDDDDDDDDGNGQGKGKGLDKNKNKGGDDDDDDGGKETSAYCAGDKDKDHPFAEGVAETYGVSKDDVMFYFCQGYGFGQIMLAIQTGQMDGVTSSVGDMLAARKSGMGWGQIWKDMGIVGNKDHGKSPPGLLKKPDKTTGPPEGKGWKKEDGD
jgi:hypothetical protein